jgi:Raf kinase inhibitor-like YbhB/YbcL family protein
MRGGAAGWVAWGLRASAAWSLWALAAALPAGAAPDAETTKERTMDIVSEAFTAHGEIPSKYTCDGADTSPPLAWDGVPEGTRSLALVVDDPDAPDPAAPRRVWVHWVLYNLAPEAAGLPAAVPPRDLPPGTAQGKNDWGRTGYGGPCPPIGRHRYFFKLYALDVVLPDLGAPTKADLLAAMEGHVVAQAELIGTYQRGR